MMFSHVATVCLLACFVTTTRATRGDDLEALCAGKDIPLKQQKQLLALAKQLDDDQGGECHDKTAAALRDLRAVIERNRLNECSMGAVERYKEFYLTYLDTSAKNNSTKDQEEGSTITQEDTSTENQEAEPTFVALPQPLRKFALAYGSQMSALCRLNMVNTLLNEGRRYVTPQDFEAVSDIIDVKGPLGIALGYQAEKSPDLFLLPTDFILALGKNTNNNNKLGVKVAVTPLIKSIQLRCERRFKPIYEPLMLPVARMANLGFEYRKSLLKDALNTALKDKATRDVIGKWTRVAFMCELLDKLELVEAPEDRERSEGNDATLVNVVTKDTTTTSSSDEHEPKGVNLLDEIDIDEEAIERVNFKPILSVDLPEKILDRGQSRAIKWINTDRDELANIRKRLLSKVISRLWDSLSQYRMTSLFGHLFKEIKMSFKKMKENEDSVTDPSDVQTNVVSYINNLVDMEFNPTMAVAAGKEGGMNKPTKILLMLMGAVVVALLLAIIYNGVTMSASAAAVGAYG